MDWAQTYVFQVLIGILVPFTQMEALASLHLKLNKVSEDLESATCNLEQKRIEVTMSHRLFAPQTKPVFVTAKGSVQAT